MRVAVCDDEKEAVLYLSELLKREELIQGIRTFTNQKEFLQKIRGGETFDIVFMDIDWKDETDGIQLSKMLYELAPMTQIIYVTGFNERFSQQIFFEKSNLCGYLVKPVKEELLHKLLQKAKENAEYIEEKLVIRQNGLIQAVPIQEICYLESKGHHVIIHTSEKSIEVYGRLEHMKEKLPKNFLQCHKSYVVNMNYIMFIDKSEILLKGNYRVNISRDKYSEVREKYFLYIGERL
ncbi:MAG: response regulator transcription factor [Lachnospiraceae bacterium]|nr:response regulator transcription factor [Lachnospiraceae bacterium]